MLQTKSHGLCMRNKRRQPNVRRRAMLFAERPKVDRATDSIGRARGKIINLRRAATKGMNGARSAYLCLRTRTLLREKHNR